MMNNPPANFIWPEPTEDNRRELGCYRKTVDDPNECWCGHWIIDGLGACHQCQYLTSFQDVGVYNGQ